MSSSLSNTSSPQSIDNGRGRGSFSNASADSFQKKIQKSFKFVGKRGRCSCVSSEQQNLNSNSQRTRLDTLKSEAHINFFSPLRTLFDYYFFLYEILLSYDGNKTKQSADYGFYYTDRDAIFYCSFILIDIFINSCNKVYILPYSFVLKNISSVLSPIIEILIDTFIEKNKSKAINYTDRNVFDLLKKTNDKTKELFSSILSFLEEKNYFDPSKNDEGWNIPVVSDIDDVFPNFKLSTVLLISNKLEQYLSLFSNLKNNVNTFNFSILDEASLFVSNIHRELDYLNKNFYSDFLDADSLARIQIISKQQSSSNNSNLMLEAIDFKFNLFFYFIRFCKESFSSSLARYVFKKNFSFINELNYEASSDSDIKKIQERVNEIFFFIMQKFSNVSLHDDLRSFFCRDGGEVLDSIKILFSGVFELYKNDFTNSVNSRFNYFLSKFTSNYEVTNFFKIKTEPIFFLFDLETEFSSFEFKKIKCELEKKENNIKEHAVNWVKQTLDFNKKEKDLQALIVEKEALEKEKESLSKTLKIKTEIVENLTNEGKQYREKILSLESENKEEKEKKKKLEDERNELVQKAKRLENSSTSASWEAQINENQRLIVSLSEEMSSLNKKYIDSLEEFKKLQKQLDEEIKKKIENENTIRELENSIEKKEREILSKKSRETKDGFVVMSGLQGLVNDADCIAVFDNVDEGVLLSVSSKIERERQKRVEFNKYKSFVIDIHEKDKTNSSFLNSLAKMIKRFESSVSNLFDINNSLLADNSRLLRNESYYQKQLDEEIKKKIENENTIRELENSIEKKERELILKNFALEHGIKKGEESEHFSTDNNEKHEETKRELEEKKKEIEMLSKKIEELARVIEKTDKKSDYSLSSVKENYFFLNDSLKYFFSNFIDYGFSELDFLEKAPWINKVGKNKFFFMFIFSVIGFWKTLSSLLRFYNKKIRKRSA